MSDIKEKTCPICFDKFTPSHNQKYCEECRKNPRKYKKQYEMARRRFTQLTDPYPGEPKSKTNICRQCKRTFTKSTFSYFCSDVCRQKYLIDNAFCANCHKNLKSVGIIITEHVKGEKHFCSDRCKQIHELSHKRQPKKKIEKICENCNKPYTNNNQRFCCNACSREYAQKQKSERQTKNNILIDRICTKCNTAYQLPEINLRFDKYQLCEKCRRIHNMLESKKHNKAYLDKQKAQNINPNINCNTEKLEKNGLCFYCKTSYKKCEYAVSKYTKYPDGTELKNNKVIKCPSFKK